MEPIKVGYDSDFNSYSFENLINEIMSKKIKKIIVMTGAGISTPSGIPDFRSPGTGLYNNLSQYDIPYPEAIFEKSFFRQNPKPFFTLAKDLIPNIDSYKPNRIHYFLRLLQDKNLLYRLYTQNIDGLELISGIDQKKLVEAHGSFRTAKCINCNVAYSGLYVKNEVVKSKIPLCKYGNCTGVVKPDIVFFGEKLPDSFYMLHEHDFSSADCVIVMGTSLEVEPFSNILKHANRTTPRLLMNKESVGPFKLIKKGTRRRDIQILGDLIQSVEKFINELGWTAEFEELILKETNYINSNKNLILEKHYYRINSDNIRNNKNNVNSAVNGNKKINRPSVERVSKTSYEKRQKIDVFRKNPLIQQFSKIQSAKRQSKLEENKKNQNTSKIVNKRNSSANLNKNKFKQIKDNESSDKESDSSESESEESDNDVQEKIENKNNILSKNKEEIINDDQLNRNNNDLLYKKYEFQFKLTQNLHDLEQKFSKISLNPSLKQVPNSKVISIFNKSTSNEEEIKTNKIFFQKNSLFTANSRPLLLKRVQSCIERK